MEISCTICSDLFTKNSNMVLNQCGHMFHYACLIQWFERSKTCPECRASSTKKSIVKAYFNFLSTEHVTDNVGTLQTKLDSAKFKLLVAQKELKELYEKFDMKEAQTVGLIQVVKESEDRIGSLQSTMHGLKEQINFYKKRAMETEKWKNEANEMRSALQEFEKIQAVINGTRAEVTEILKNETDIEALAILSATLKKTLIDMERKTNLIQNRLRDTHYELSKYKKKYVALDSLNSELRKNLNDAKKSWEEEKQYLRQKIQELNNLSNQRTDKPLESMDNSVQRILAESPAPLPRRRGDTKCDMDEVKRSPTVPENVINILDSDSPYLRIKTNYSSSLHKKVSVKLGEKKTIQRTPVQGAVAFKPSTSQTVFNGLGGQVNEDLTKFPEKKGSGLKRSKTSSTISSNKFRKLAPGPSTKKITDFVTLD